MKTVILAGGYGTRLSEKTSLIPKPMVEIGGMPILWHIMKIYSSYGHNDFIICLGYKGSIVKNFFANYRLQSSNLTVNLRDNTIELLNNNIEPWKITLVDTGEKTMTGGRLKRVKEYVGNDTFFMTYGDGVSDVNINKLLAFHKRNKTFATVTAVQPPGRFGLLSLCRDNSLVVSYKEKPLCDSLEPHWINGGFFVLEPKIFDFIEGDSSIWERTPMETLAKRNQLTAYKHTGYWQNMDNMNDKNKLDEAWEDFPPWKIW